MSTFTIQTFNEVESTNSFSLWVSRSDLGINKVHVLWLGNWWYTWACCLYLSLPNHVYKWEIFKCSVFFLSCTCQSPQSIADILSLLIFSELWWLSSFESDFLTQVSPAASRECGKTRKTSKAPGLPEAIPSGSFTVGQCKAWRHRWEMSLSSFIEDTKGSNMMISLPLQFINQLLVHVYPLHRHFQDMLFFTNPCAPWELNLRPCCC